MALPHRTLCWVEGPPWDRSCDPVITQEMIGHEVVITDDMVSAALAVLDQWKYEVSPFKMREALEAALKS